MKNMDDILKSALTPKDEPDFWLNQNILSQSKEVTRMKKMSRKKYATIVCSCALALGIGSISVYAAWKYLKPDEIVEEMGLGSEIEAWNLKNLKEAFSGENAVYINETQSYGGYDVTLLGMTSGENLTEYKFISDDVEQTDRSYIIFALEHESKSLKSICDFEQHVDLSFFPIIMGYDYEITRGLFSDGGRQIEKDGVLYFMFECNNLEKFADHDIYMCVSDDLPEFSEYSYIYDNDTGIIARNEEFDGLNALFTLPLDPIKADPAAAKETIANEEARIKAVREEEAKNENRPLTKTEQKFQEAFEFVDQITPENINDYATPITDEGATETFTADAQGRFNNYNSYLGLHERGTIEDLFPDGKTEYITSYGISNNDPETLVIGLYTLNEDQTVTLQLYKPNLPK